MECRVLAILSPTSIWVVVAARNSADFAKPKPKFSIFSMGAACTRGHLLSDARID